ncbi:17-beta-hydroxysteroid dehydrogenase 13-like [Aphidius gifuensis]|uniref:17-beta-hydroxysteroid dehydrogenase 13-like n=1 Tax=Aphidius gifuensis TaxID=684658 RepID=UPI001CDD263A|nr:17-beta-hydroxysteroid dehydrogenase 13-like [Aphidius gifuensis]XP_044001248.1 17-beta-hydroxysteroid dehydrogenase 13-like [Aphidius gifuensis]
MLLKIYSLFILSLDLITLFFGIWLSIILAIYRSFNPPSLKSLHGEIAMVVGAGRGVGREIAIQLSQLGAIVACIDINEDMCNKTSNKAIRYSGQSKAYACDVTDKLQVENTVKKIRADFGDVTMVIHCCGVPSPRVLIRETPEIQKAMELSVISHFWLLDAVLPSMEKAGRGHIVALSSVAGFSGGSSRGGRVQLTAAQFAIQGLTESLNSELRQVNSNIVVTLVHIYPFILGAEMEKDIRLRIPSYFGTMPATEAAKNILDGVRRNYTEFSVPGYLLYLGHILRILPKTASFLLRDFLDTGVDFG